MITKNNENIISTDIINIIKDTTVNFSHFKNGNAYYVVRAYGFAYEFPIKLETIGEICLKRSEPAYMYSKWIREAINNKTFIRR